jgi:NTE family protein
MKKIGYVLSGGGARGFAHLGIIKYLQELSISPYAISGTSAGALAGALIAAGKQPEEIMSFVKKYKFFGWSSFAWRSKGIFSMEVLRNFLKQVIGEDDFKSLKIPFFATATDINKGCSITFSEGKLFDAVIASCSVPIVYNSVTIGEKVLVDGGVLNNFALEPLLDICDVIIGSYVNKLDEGIGNNSFSNPVNVLERCFHLAISRSVYNKKDKCNVFIECPLHAYNMYDVKDADAIFEIGYKTAREYRGQLERIMENK